MKSNLNYDTYRKVYEVEGSCTDVPFTLTFSVTEDTLVRYVGKKTYVFCVAYSLLQEFNEVQIFSYPELDGELADLNKTMKVCQNSFGTFE